MLISFVYKGEIAQTLYTIKEERMRITIKKQKIDCLTTANLS